MKTRHTHDRPTVSQVSLALCASLLGVLLTATAAGTTLEGDDVSPVRLALEAAEHELGAGQLDKARAHVQRALERDKRSIPAWRLRMRIADSVEDRDESVVLPAPGLPPDPGAGAPAEGAARRARPLARAARRRRPARHRPARDARPVPRAARGPRRQVRKGQAPPRRDPRPQADPGARPGQREQPGRDRAHRVRTRPEPRGPRQAKDLFADVTDEWIAEFDAEHTEWEDRAKLERENYVTYTDAGYEMHGPQPPRPWSR